MPVNISTPEVCTSSEPSINSIDPLAAESGSGHGSDSKDALQLSASGDPLEDMAQSANGADDSETAEEAAMFDDEEEVERMKEMKDLVFSFIDETEEKLYFTVWDFGGQKEFYGQHHLFLTRFAMYVITVNMEWLLPGASEQKKEALEYIGSWLNSVSIHAIDPVDGSMAPIIIVGTHKDKVPNPADHEQISQLLYDTFSTKNAWRGIVSHKNGTVSTGRGRLWIWPVDNTKGESDHSLTEIQHIIQRTVEKEKYVNHKVPFSWLGAFEKLQEEAEMGSNAITLTRVIGICQDSGMPSLAQITLEDEVLTMLKFFHELGYVMHHNDPALKELVILDPISFSIKPTSRIMCKLDIHEDYFIEAARKNGGNLFGKLSRGLLDRRLLSYFWSDCLQHQQELEALNVKYGLFIPIVDEEQADRCEYLVPAQLPKTLTTSNSSEDKLVAFLVFSHSDIMEEWRGKKKGYVSVEDAKSQGFLPRCLFSVIAGRILEHAQCVFNMSYDDMKLSNTEMSLSFQKHKFSIRELPDYNMLQILIRVETGLMIADTIVNLVEKTLSRVMPGLKFALIVPSDGGKLINGLAVDCRSPMPNCTSHLVIVDGKGGLQQKLDDNAHVEIAIGPGIRISAVESRKRFEGFLPPKGYREWYDAFLSYRWSDFDTELNVAVFSKISMELIGVNDRQVQAFLDRIRLRDGQNFSTEFSSAIVSSTGAVPIVSFAALQRMLTLQVFGAC